MSNRTANNASMVNDEELREIIYNASSGGQQAWAEKHGFSRQYVNQVANGNKPISDKIAKAVGYVRQWVRRTPAKK